jgi:hypothetical protein
VLAHTAMVQHLWEGRQRCLSARGERCMNVEEPERCSELSAV